MADLLFYILRSWKRIVVIGLIAGLLMTSLFVFKTAISWNSKKASIDDYTKQYEINYAFYEETYDEYNDRIDKAQDLVFEHTDEFINSAASRITDDNVYVASESLYFLNDNFPLGYYVYTVLLMRCEAYFNNDINWDAICEDLDIDDSYINRLFVCQTDYLSSRITLTVLYEDERADEILDYIISDFLEMQPEMIADFSNFSIVEGNRGVAFHYDEASTISDAIINEINAEQEQVNFLIEQRDVIKDQLPPVPITMPSKLDLAISTIKYFAVGFGGIVILFALWKSLLFVFSKRIYSINQLNSYGNTYAVFGTKLSKVDKKLFKIENSCGNYSFEDAIKRLIIMADDDIEGKRIMITGDFDSDELPGIADLLKSIKFRDCSFGYEGNIVNNLNSYKNMMNYDYAIVLVGRDKTYKSMFINEIQQMNKTVLGYIMLVK